jgi:hypothetical protein
VSDAGLGAAPLRARGPAAGVVAWFPVRPGRVPVSDTVANRYCARAAACPRYELASFAGRKDERMSIGAGKTIVVDCDEPSSSSVCR